MARIKLSPRLNAGWLAPVIDGWSVSCVTTFTSGAPFTPSYTTTTDVLFRAEGYSVWNHTQFSGCDTSARFDATGAQVNATIGAYNAARQARIIAFSLRLQF